VAEITAVKMPRQRIDFSALRTLTQTMPMQKESASKLVRRMRDQERY
jgi:hypothetical protein